MEQIECRLRVSDILVVSNPTNGDCLLGVENYDVYLSKNKNCPAPWGYADDVLRESQAVQNAIDTNPAAATMLIEQLRVAETLAFERALDRESRAYSTLLNGDEFHHWLVHHGPRSGEPIPQQPIELARNDDGWTIILNDPANRNAISAPMRDALFDALTNIADDKDAAFVRIYGAGACFSVGGHLPEFGTATDVVAAHDIRMERSIARLIHQQSARVEVHFHGAVVGSGLEIFAAADRCVAAKGTWFQLPEVAMGLIPGAGGTVTVPRRIGRERAAYMMVSGRRINAATALNWGLIDEIVE
jgi:Enoyl-CoA hydratase/isomerase